ncbi:hypothetical protein F383_37756 [Gossypium arboreum]|uniref:Uncharacterized protein n=1 Tax=Gossypium arboreum TaxID=29729 RepID=A0A0B0MGT4_GOSAR|nr:hypothetical protein F383_37756 [Gossypium arboreum]
MYIKDLARTGNPIRV